MKVIIAGGRDFIDYERLKSHCNYILQNTLPNVEIISGGAKGADRLCEVYAKEYNLPIKIFKANWDKFGKSAGYIRNKDMAEYGDALICFWDGVSRGSGHMIDLAKEYGLKISINRY